MVAEELEKHEIVIDQQTILKQLVLQRRFMDIIVLIKVLDYLKSHI